ncbi:hypothetical protein DEO72_LG3g1282 [Vigna unguiculata]|uniref:Uncharacterized protein n=1 Tax=Vigna unguiculata TaxID=3917 RepID=A0A4D6LEB5_VIGUN|nr:hypothetical protein DEO72_LG3g1282 [Vigna unguiculata]
MARCGGDLAVASCSGAQPLLRWFVALLTVDRSHDGVAGVAYKCVMVFASVGA